MALVQGRTAGTRRSRIINGTIVNGVLAFIVILWTIPTLGLLVSSFRARSDVITTGWWTIFPHTEYVSTGTPIQLSAPPNLQQPINVEGQTYTNDQLTLGVKTPDGRILRWINKRSGIIDVQTMQWVARDNFTLSNYDNVIVGQQYTYQDNGVTKTDKGENMLNSFISSLTVAIPATIIPILIAAFAAYGFAWMRFPGRKILFTMVIALLVIPAQVALIPMLKDFKGLGINGTYLSLWIIHTGFGLCLATYLLYNYISGIPREILESAFIDGASQFTIFTTLILPLSVPALASFAIFQFMWVWNDFLNALIFLGTDQDIQVMTVRLQQMLGSRGQDWHLLTAGAFVTMLLPLIVFFSLQRYFVRGMMAGSVKG